MLESTGLRLDHWGRLKLLYILTFIYYLISTKNVKRNYNNITINSVND